MELHKRNELVLIQCFEESGSNPHLITTYNQSEALVELMGTRFGTRYVWGKK